MSIYHSTKVVPYVYRLDNPITGEFYIGYRYTNKTASSEDFGLTYKTSAPEIEDTFEQFNWYIVAEFFDADSAYDFEQLLIFENWNNPLLLNKNCFHNKKRFKQTNSGIEKMRKSKTGKSRSSETKEKIRLANLGSNSPKFGKPMSEYTKELLRLVNTGENNSNYGKPPHNKGIQQSIIACPHCNKSGGSSAMKRYHFDNCKLLVTCEVK